MGIDCWFVIELYNEVTQTWELVKWNNYTNVFEDAHVEVLEQAPGESDEHFELRYDDYRETFPCNYIKRNYRLFALLANVCNNYDIIPAAELRGLPLNISDDAKNVVFECGSDDEHSTFFEIWELIDILDNDVRHPNGLLYWQFCKGELIGFEEMIDKVDVNRNCQRARLIMLFG